MIRVLLELLRRAAWEATPPAERLRCEGRERLRRRAAEQRRAS
ncbi:MAG: hypothetical protein ACRD2Z_03255 [Thermoanaerobaculia bacterium]